MQQVSSKKTNGIFTFNPDPKTGTYTQAKGGTELMHEGLLFRLDPELMENFQIICSRVRDLEPNKKRILWLHDTFDDPESAKLSDANFRAQFDKLVFVSDYQFTTYNVGLGVPYEKTRVLRNAIMPIPEHKKPTGEKINLIYHTTPHRGLELLVPAFLELLKYEPNIHLDVYSSFKIYGWEHRDVPYQKLFDICRDHPNITYHGTVSNDEVRRALMKAHIFAFPSIWPETSCIAAIEAMSAGCAIVSSDFGALPETLNGYGYQYRFSENHQEHINTFASVLLTVIQNYHTSLVQDNLRNQKLYADMKYDWTQRAGEWTHMLKEML